jgi:hypothetical protein
VRPGKLADHLIVMAKGEALEPLGERDAGIQVVEDWMQSSGF